MTGSAVHIVDRRIDLNNTVPTPHGGLYSFAGSPTILNCNFTGNASGGMCNLAGSNPAVANCTFVQNHADRGCDVYAVCSALACSMSMSNCIFRDSADPICVNDPCVTTLSISYCDVQGGWAGEGNIDVDPLFADPGYWDPNGTSEDFSDDFFVEGDYHLKSQAGRWDPNSQDWVRDDMTSPCIDAGDPNDPVGDEPFPNGGRINMGAYGGTAEASRSYDADASREN